MPPPPPLIAAHQSLLRQLNKRSIQVRRRSRNVRVGGQCALRVWRDVYLPTK